MTFEEGKEYICVKSVYNMFGMPLFIEGQTYKVIGIDGDEIYMNHILYANEYASKSKEFLEGKFEIKMV